MAITIKKLHNANVFINGVNMAGRATEVDLPDVKYKLHDAKNLGMFMATGVPVALEVLKLKIKAEFDPAYVALAVNPFDSSLVQIRGTISEWDSSGRVGEKGAVAICKGRFTDSKVAAIKAQETATCELEMTVDYYKLIAEGQTIYEIDVFNNKLVIEGDDKLADFKGNLSV